MEPQVSEPPVVRCPGCNQPMEPQERALVTERLVDIRYVCAVCGIEIAPEPTGHGSPLGKCEAYNRVYDQPCGSS
jgi:hypothetical protein